MGLLGNSQFSFENFLFHLCFSLALLSLIDVETNECLHNNGGCWEDKTLNVSACKVCIDIMDLRHVLVVLFMSDCLPQIVRTRSVGGCVTVR